MNIQKTLEDHKLWVLTEGKEGARANLRGAYLRGANLRDADLRDADLRDADLRDADLSDANLRDANLHGANLRYADLSDADLRYAYLRNANLHGADLHGAYLHIAYLHGANVSDARGLLQWQAPQGEKRICYSVKYDDCVMHKLGCFWGATDKAVKAIRKKYGEDSFYQKFLLMQVEALEGE